MTAIGEWRARLRQQLRPVAGEFAPGEADAILGEVLSVTPTHLTLRSGEQLPAEHEVRLRELIAKRLTGMPLPYVLGHVEFYGLDLICDERVLIPRPETEEVVSVALRSLPHPDSQHHPLVVDVGTGSGNIAVALTKNRPDLRVIAIDISDQALQVARINRDRHKLSDRIYLIRGRSLTALPPGLNVDLIVSNPPYVPVNDPDVQCSVHDFEPHVALYAGMDGTEVLQDLIGEARLVLRAGGALVCEIGYNQADQLRRLVRRCPGWHEPVLHRSVAGLDRVMELRRMDAGLS